MVVIHKKTSEKELKNMLEFSKEQSVKAADINNQHSNDSDCFQSHFNTIQ